MRILALLVVLIFAVSSINAQTFNVKSADSKLKWTGEKVVGKHFGTVKIGDGELKMKGEAVTGTFAIDMTSITVDDIDASQGADKLKGHLSSADFFDVAKHPTASLRITGSKRILKNEAANYELTGVLAIKGIENEVTFPAKILVEGSKLKATASFKIDRTKWDIKYNSGSFFSDLGDYMIYDDVLFDVDITGIASTAAIKK